MADTELNTPRAEFLQDVLHGLSQPQKSLPCKYFYDEAGSELFEQITALPEYYPTRTELALFDDIGDDIAAVVAPHARIVEYGAGALRKVRWLLDTLDSPSAYVPIDVSDEFLHAAARLLSEEYPELAVQPVIGSFLDPTLSVPLPEGEGSVLGFFPGSTLGNLSDQDILSFLRMARRTLGDTAQFLIGVDINQDEASLIPAYNDAAGVTAAFNLNLLSRINRELEGGFNLTKFQHEARWNAKDHRIEMHLISTETQSVSVGGHVFDFEAGETIHSENSRKFELDQLQRLFVQSGWQLNRHWTDLDKRFAVLLLS